MRNRLVLMSALVLAAAACLPEGKDFTGPTSPYNLELRGTPASVNMAVGEAMSVAVGDTAGDISVFVYDVGSSNVLGNAFPSVSVVDPAIADFDEDGNLVALASGTTTITATFEDLNRDTTLTLDIPVTVSPAP